MFKKKIASIGCLYICFCFPREISIQCEKPKNNNTITIVVDNLHTKKDISCSMEVCSSQDLSLFQEKIKKSEIKKTDTPSLSIDSSFPAMPARIQADKKTIKTVNKQSDEKLFPLYADYRKEALHKRKKKIETFVQDACNYAQEHSLIDSCVAFSSERKWLCGDNSLFVIDENCICYVDGDWKLSPWSVVTQKECDILKSASERGEWVMHRWHDALHYSFVSKITKQGKVFLVCSGFYPKSICLRSEELINDMSYYLTKHTIQHLIQAIDNGESPFAYDAQVADLVIVDMKGAVVFEHHNKGEYEATWYTSLLKKVEKDGSMHFINERNGFKKIIYARFIHEIDRDRLAVPYLAIISHSMSRKNLNKEAAEAATFFIKEKGVAEFCDLLINTPHLFATGNMRIELLTKEGIELANSYRESSFKCYPNKKQWNEIVKIARSGGGMHCYQATQGMKTIFVQPIKETTIALINNIDEKDTTCLGFDGILLAWHYA